MRTQLATLTFAGLAILATATGAPASASGEPSVGAAPTVAVHRMGLALPAVRDEATMVLVGTALLFLAAAVRRAS
jgi:hypothetical protein